MIVFEYLYSMMDVFGPLMDQYANGEIKLIDSKEVSILAINILVILVRTYISYTRTP